VKVRQKVYQILNHQRLSLKRRSKVNANIRSCKESHSPAASVVHENLQGLRFTQCFNCNKMQKVQGQKPALEEARNSKVTDFFYFIFVP